jgi:hypothetical protein
VSDLGSNCVSIDEARLAAIGARADEMRHLQEYVEEQLAVSDDFDDRAFRRYILIRKAAIVAMAVKPAEAQTGE